MSLQDPTKKMSKSHADPRSRILITDSAEDILRKILAAKTDSNYYASYDPATRPGVSNLIALLSYFDKAGRTPEELGKACEEMTMPDLKRHLAHTVSEALEGVRDRYFEFLKRGDGKYLDEVEHWGAAKARTQANNTLRRVKEAMGLN
jgi:tryptophanyl-tRNA synthetase